MNNKEVMTVTGNTAQITSTLNSRAGGGIMAPGATMFATWVNEMPARINPNLPRIMEQGGVVRPISQANSFGTGTVTYSPLFQKLIAEMHLNTQEIKTVKTNLKAIVSVQELRQVERQIEAAKKASVF